MKYSLRRSLQKIDYKKLFYRVLSLSAVLLLVSGYIAYTRLYLTPERRFWRAVSNSLSTPSVVRSTESGGTGNKSTEVTRFTYGAQAVQNKISSVGFKNATAQSNVVTQTMSTPKTQYVRYLSIFSTERKEDGSRYDFSKVIGTWAKEDENRDEEAVENQRTSFIQPLVTLIPFGNLSADVRNELVADLRNSGAFEVNYKIVAPRESDEGIKYLDYRVKVHTKKYVTILQKYFKVAGYGEFPPLNPSGYSDAAKVVADFTIDMKRESIAGIAFNEQTENYSNFGVAQHVNIPTKTVSLGELQKRLQSAQ
jgi:hypothetical protein